MWDVVSCEESRDQMSDWPSFSAVRTELEGAQAMLSTEDTKGQNTYVKNMLIDILAQKVFIDINCNTYLGVLICYKGSVVQYI